MAKIGRIAKATALVGVLYGARSYYRNWGATKAESQTALPGDALVRDPALQATEAVFIDAPAAAVWPQLLRIGAHAGGFYGHGTPEDSAELNQSSGAPCPREQQQISAGDSLRLRLPGLIGSHHEMMVSVAEIVQEKYVVLKLTTPGQQWDAVLSFHLQPHWDDRVRLLARSRIALRHPGELFAVEVARPLAALGTRGLLLTTKRRAERISSKASHEHHSAVQGG